MCFLICMTADIIIDVLGSFQHFFSCEWMNYRYQNIKGHFLQFCPQIWHVWSLRRSVQLKNTKVFINEWYLWDSQKSSDWPSWESQNLRYSPVSRLVKAENIKATETHLKPKHLLHIDTTKVWSQLKVNQYFPGSKSTSVFLSHKMFGISNLILS